MAIRRQTTTEYEDTNEDGVYLQDTSNTRGSDWWPLLLIPLVLLVLLGGFSLYQSGYSKGNTAIPPSINQYNVGGSASGGGQMGIGGAGEDTPTPEVVILPTETPTATGTLTSPVSIQPTESNR